MRVVGLVAGVLLALAGGVWILQGLNVPFAPRSFMTGGGTWVLLGVLALLAGVTVAALSLRGR